MKLVLSKFTEPQRNLKFFEQQNIYFFLLHKMYEIHEYMDTNLFFKGYFNKSDQYKLQGFKD